VLLEMFIPRATTLFAVSGEITLFVASGATTLFVVTGATMLFAVSGATTLFAANGATMLFITGATRVFVITGTFRPLGSPELPLPGAPGGELRLSARKLLVAVGTDVVRPDGGPLAAAVPVGPF
jgi:hypothetical protein